MQSAELFLKSRGQYISRVMVELLLTVGFLVLYVERDDLALSVEGVPPRQVRRPRGEPGDGQVLRHLGHLLRAVKCGTVLSLVGGGCANRTKNRCQIEKQKSNTTHST